MCNQASRISFWNLSALEESYDYFFDTATPPPSSHFPSTSNPLNLNLGSSDGNARPAFLLPVKKRNRGGGPLGRMRASSPTESASSRGQSKSVIDDEASNATGKIKTSLPSPLYKTFRHFPQTRRTN